MSGRLMAKAREATRIAPVNTVKKVAVGAETRCSPTVMRMYPLEKPKAARSEKVTANAKGPLFVAPGHVRDVDS